MSPRDCILGIVLAGGEGTRLAPLTAERSKPAVPFGGRYRITIHEDDVFNERQLRVQVEVEKEQLLQRRLNSTSS